MTIHKRISTPESIKLLGLTAEDIRKRYRGLTDEEDGFETACDLLVTIIKGAILPDKQNITREALESDLRSQGLSEALIQTALSRVWPA